MDKIFTPMNYYDTLTISSCLVKRAIWKVISDCSLRGERQGRVSMNAKGQLTSSQGSIKDLHALVDFLRLRKMTAAVIYLLNVKCLPVQGFYFWTLISGSYLLGFSQCMDPIFEFINLKVGDQQCTTSIDHWRQVTFLRHACLFGHFLMNWPNHVKMFGS